MNSLPARALQDYEKSLEAEIAKLKQELMPLVERCELALEMAERYGTIDGEHHKTWVIDQMVRALTGERYAEWIRQQCEGEDGPNTYSWDEGIPP